MPEVLNKFLIDLPDVGLELLHWRLTALHAEARVVRFEFGNGAAEVLRFRLAQSGDDARKGPFDFADVSLAYEQSPLPFEVIEKLAISLRTQLADSALSAQELLLAFSVRAARAALQPLVWHLRAKPLVPIAQDLLEAILPDVMQHIVVDVAPQHRQSAESLEKTLRQHGIRQISVREGDRATATRPVDGAQIVPQATEIRYLVSGTSPDAANWRELAREKLLDRPNLSLRLADLVPAEQLPLWPCSLPWTRLEYSQGQLIGPCCAEYQTQSHPAVPFLPQALWQGEAMRSFRRAMASGNLGATCRSTCPVLTGRTEAPSEVRLRGGPIEAIAAQLLTIDDMLCGNEVMRGGPLTIGLTVTSFCNYDCLMCPCGEEGKLTDQLTPEFYANLRPLLQTAQVLEVNGGEPLASPNFREFLAQMDAREVPQLRINLITNGSYLVPKLLDRLQHVPFGNVTFSLNAASDASYLLVNRGLEFDRIRSHLRDFHNRRQDGMRGEVTYSMVILKQNLHEIEDFARLALQDQATVRFMLPFRDRHGSSIMTDRRAMLAALRSLQRVVATLLSQGKAREARNAAASARVLLERLDGGVLQVL